MQMLRVHRCSPGCRGHVLRPDLCREGLGCSSRSACTGLDCASAFHCSMACLLRDRSVTVCAYMHWPRHMDLCRWLRTVA